MSANEPVTAFFEAVELVKRDIELDVTGEVLQRDAQDLLTANDAVFGMGGDLDPNTDDERCAAMQSLEAPLLAKGINLREMALQGS